MPASIRGHQGRIKVFKNGQDTGIDIAIVSAEVNQDSNFTRSFYVGKRVAEGDQSMEGWSGSMDLEVKGAQVDNLVDALVSGNLAGIGGDEMTTVIEEFYPNGEVQAYVYADMQFRMSKRVGGQNEKQTKRLDWQASFRQKI